jgi:hypothetical protein
MRNPMRWLLALLVLGGLATVARAAETPPSCSAAASGQVACLVHKLCVCSYDGGGAMTGEQPGYRWDCGILQPACEGGAGTPATTGGYDGPLPDTVWVEPTLPRKMDDPPRYPKGR